MNPSSVVITTVQAPTDCTKALAERISNTGAELIVIGDEKGPDEFPLPGARFWSLQDQMSTGFSLAHELPTCHYGRKNIGYLLAIRNGSDVIYETDDDNMPLECWKMRTPLVNAVVREGKGWFNVYSEFSYDRIWPRGFPLDEIDSPRKQPTPESIQDGLYSPIQQGSIRRKSSSIETNTI